MSPHPTVIFCLLCTGSSALSGCDLFGGGEEGHPFSFFPDSVWVAGCDTGNPTLNARASDYFPVEFSPGDVERIELRVEAGSGEASGQLYTEIYLIRSEDPTPPSTPFQPVASRPLDELTLTAREYQARVYDAAGNEGFMPVHLGCR